MTDLASAAGDEALPDREPSAVDRRRTWPSARAGTNRTRLFAVLACVLVVFVAGELVLEGDALAVHVWADTWWTVVSLVAALRCWRTAEARTRPHQRAAWRCFAAGSLCWFIGMLAWDWYELARGVVTPFPSVADLGFLALPAWLVVGLFFLRVDAPSRALSLKQLGDLVIVLACLATVSTVMLYQPASAARDEPVFVVTALAYPVLHIAALAFALTTLWHQPAGSRRRITSILLCAAAVLATVMTFYSVSLLTRTYEAGDQLDVLWIVAFAMLIWAASEEDWSSELGCLARPSGPDRVLAPDLLVAPLAVCVFAISVAIHPEGLRAERALAIGIGGVGLAVGLTLLLMGMHRIELALREDIRRRELRNALLADAGLLVAESLELDEILRRLSDLVVHSVADWCQFDLVEDGAVRRIAGAHAESTKMARLEELARRYPAGRKSPHPASYVLRTGKPLLLAEITDEWLRRHTVDEEHRRLIEDLGALSVIAVPLYVRERVLGVLSVVSAKPDRRYGPTDLELIEELARRGAMAIDNSKAYQEARDAIRLRDEFLGVASHELYTPMTSLLLTLEVLRASASRGALDPVALSRALELVERQGRKMTRRIQQLLDITRLEAGKMRLDVGDVELAALVREVAATFEREAAANGSTIAIDAPSAVHGRWDRARVEQVVTNLISNAVKFGLDRPIEVSVSISGSWAELRVRDHGIGIDPAKHAKIFDRFGRAVSARHFGGLGLGLHVSREIVDAHGGTIAVESTLGAGAAFTVRLPGAEEAPAS